MKILVLIMLFMCGVGEGITVSSVLGSGIPYAIPIALFGCCAILWIMYLFLNVLKDIMGDIC